MAQFFADTFTATGPIVGYEYSANWHRCVGSSHDFYVTNGKAHGNGNYAYPDWYNDYATPPSADYTVSADVTLSSVLAGTSVGVLIRCQSATKNYYVGYINHDGSWGIAKNIAGTWTDIRQGTATVAAGNTYRILLKAEGTTLTLYLDGVQLGTPVDDSSVTAAGYPGVFFGAAANPNSATTAFQIDNISADTLASPDGSATGATLSGTSSISAGAATGNGAVDGSASGATIAGASSIAAGSASGGSGAISVTNPEPLYNNTLNAPLSGVVVNWSWYTGGRIGSLAGITPVEGTATLNGSGFFTITGISAGAGICLFSKRNTGAADDAVGYFAATAA